MAGIESDNADAGPYDRRAGEGFRDRHCGQSRRRGGPNHRFNRFIGEDRRHG